MEQIFKESRRSSKSAWKLCWLLDHLDAEDFTKVYESVLKHYIFSNVTLNKNKLYMKNKTLIEQLQKVIDELQKDLKNKDELFCVVGHEIKNYIHGIHFTSDYLHQDYDKINDGDRKNHIYAISKSVEGLKHLANDLLDLSKFNSGQLAFDFHNIDLLEILHKVIDYCNKVLLVNKKLPIIFKNTESNKVIIYGDHQRIEQLLMNLFINAIKYSNQGPITLALNLTNSNDINYWKFSISDQGIGIPVSDLEYVFEPFFRSSITKNLTSGSGLGLAICKKIIDAHNGKIDVKNNIDKGTTFTFILPALKNLSFED